MYVLLNMYLLRYNQSPDIDVKKKQLEKKCMLALELSIYFHDFIELLQTCEHRVNDNQMTMKK